MQFKLFVVAATCITAATAAVLEGRQAPVACSGLAGGPCGSIGASLLGLLNSTLSLPACQAPLTCQSICTASIPGPISVNANIGVSLSTSTLVVASFDDHWLLSITRLVSKLDSVTRCNSCATNEVWFGDSVLSVWCTNIFMVTPLTIMWPYKYECIWHCCPVYKCLPTSKPCRCQPKIQRNQLETRCPVLFL